jgi:hypothetical protein
MATIDVTNLIWQQTRILAFILFAHPQTPIADALNAIVSLLQSGAKRPSAQRSG